MVWSSFDLHFKTSLNGNIWGQVLRNIYKALRLNEMLPCIQNILHLKRECQNHNKTKLTLLTWQRKPIYDWEQSARDILWAESLSADTYFI